jgi:hypothetical protein
MPCLALPCTLPLLCAPCTRLTIIACLSLATDDLQKEIVQSVLNYAGFVDANALLYIWPREMLRCRICLISGDLRKPIFCTFFPAGVADLNSLDDIIIHSDGSHFTLLKPAVAENSASFSVRMLLLAVTGVHCRLTT